MVNTNSLIVGQLAAGGDVGAAFFAAAGGFYSAVTPEGLANTKFQSSATFSKFGINASSNDAASVFLFRNAGTNGNQTVSIPMGGDTFFSDTTHSDTITANSAVDFQYGNNITVTVPRQWNMQCDAIGPLTWYGTGAAGSTGSTLPSTTHYCNIQGSTNTASLANSWGSTTQSRLQAPGVLSEMGMMVASAPTGLVSATTYNGSAGNQALSFSSGTGWMQDMTHTDSVSSGQDWGYVFSSANADGVWTCMQCQFAGVTSAHDCGSSTDNTQQVGPYYNIGGFFFWGSNTSTESEVYTGAPFSFTSNLLRLRTFTSVVATGTCVSRIGSANGNQTVNFSSQTGLMMDSTHSDSITASALFDFSISNGTQWASLFIVGNDHSVGNKSGIFFHSFPP